MGDVFKEQIVKRKPTSKDSLFRVGIIVLVIIISLLSLAFLQTFAVIGIGAAAFGAAFLMRFLNIEYEYIFTNGELDIDVIYKQTSRKRLFTGNVKDFEIMAHVEDKNHAGAFGGAQETRDYSTGQVGPDSYAFLINKDGKRLKIIIEPNEKMLTAISGVMSRSKIHIKK